MPGTMSEADLVADLKASLKDAASVFTASSDADFKRHLAQAAADFHRAQALIVSASITLVAGTREYSLPADFGDYLHDTWGRARNYQPWQSGYSGRLPRTFVARVAGVDKLILDPAPTIAHIADAGESLPFTYKAKHVIGANSADTTINPLKRGLLILRAQAEAMREMAFRNITRASEVVSGYSNAPRNGTPAALFTALMEEFDKAAAC